MSELNEISNSLESTLKDTDLQSVTIDLAETFTDSFLHDGILKEIPIIGTIVGLGKTGLKIKDQLFLKKIIYFINEIKNIPAEKREAIITKIDESEQFRIKIGEKLMYIIDKTDDHEKSQTIGRLFKAFLEEKIDYDSFLRCALIVEKTMIDDLDWFVTNTWETGTIEDTGDYINWGVFEMIPLTIDLKENRDYIHEDEKRTYEISGGEIKTQITYIGKVLRLALKQ